MANTNSSCSLRKRINDIVLNDLRIETQMYQDKIRYFSVGEDCPLNFSQKYSRHSVSDLCFGALNETLQCCCGASEQTIQNYIASVSTLTPEDISSETESSLYCSYTSEYLEHCLKEFQSKAEEMLK